MKKKALPILAVLCCMLFTFGFFGCDGHEHTYATDWESDKHFHWHQATCEHTDAQGDKAAHEYGEWEVYRAATCAQDGEERKSCTTCGYYISAAIPATGVHAWDEGVTVKEPTCDVAGTAKYTCDTCGATKEESLAKHSHTLTTHAAKAATCEEAGNIAYWTCSVCDEHFLDGKANVILTDKTVVVVPAKGHVGEAVAAVEATCDKDGNIAYYECGACDKIFSDAACTTEIATEDTVINAKGHSLVKTDAVTPTCTSGGNIEYYTCSDCGKTFTDAEGEHEILKEMVNLPVLPHTITTVAATKPTCTEDGNVEYHECDECGKYFANKAATTEITDKNSVIVPALDHEYKTEWSKNETQHWHDCVRGDAQSDKADHEFDDGVVTVEPTCQSKGEKLYTCDTCGYTKTEELDELAHTLTKVDAKDSTCKDQGNTEYYVCADCQTWYTDDTATTEITDKESVKLPLLTTHTYDDGVVTTAPTCTTPGVKTFTCATCGKSYTEEVAVVAHTLTEVVAVAHTCTTDGNIAYWDCSVCGKNFDDENATTEWTDAEIVDPAAHTAKEAYSSDASFHWHDCSVCGNAIDATKAEHVYTGEGSTQACVCGKEKVADHECLYEGDWQKDNDNHWKVCTANPDCGSVSQKAAHDWDNGVIKTGDEPTCTTTGTKTYTCETCGHTKTEEVAATGHAMTKTDAKDPTCEEDGNIAYWTCSNCNKVFKDENGDEEADTTVIDKLGHTYGDLIARVEANCGTGTDGNIAHYHCSACSKYFDESKAEITQAQTVIKAEHTYGTLVAKQDETCTEDGHIAHYQCSECSKYFDESKTEVDSIVIPAAHKLTKTEAKAATCTEDGNNAYWTCSVCSKVYADEAATTETTVEASKIPAAHTFSEDWTTSATQHWHKCEKCDVTTTKEDHVIVDTKCTTCGYQQVFSVSGTVKDADNAPLAGVTVKVGESSTTTAENGTYTLSNIKVGTVSVTFSKTGYLSKTASVTGANDETKTTDVALAYGLTGGASLTTVGAPTDLTDVNTTGVTYNVYKAVASMESIYTADILKDGQSFGFTFKFNGASEGKLAHGTKDASATKTNASNYYKSTVDNITFFLNTAGCYTPQAQWEIDNGYYAGSATGTGKNPLDYSFAINHLVQAEFKYSYNIIYAREGDVVSMYAKHATDDYYVKVAYATVTKSAVQIRISLAGESGFAANWTVSDVSYGTTPADFATQVWDYSEIETTCYGGAGKNDDGTYNAYLQLTEVGSASSSSSWVRFNQTYDVKTGKLEIEADLERNSTLNWGMGVGFGLYQADDNSKMFNMFVRQDRIMFTMYHGHSTAGRTWAATSDNKGVSEYNVSNIPNNANGVWDTFKIKYVITDGIVSMYISKDGDAVDMSKDLVIKFDLYQVVTAMADGGDQSAKLPDLSKVRVAAQMMHDTTGHVDRANMYNIAISYTDKATLIANKQAELDTLRASYDNDNYTTEQQEQLDAVIAQYKEIIANLTTSSEIVNYDFSAAQAALNAVPDNVGEQVTVNITGAQANAYTLTADGLPTVSGTLAEDATSLIISLKAGEWTLTLAETDNTFASTSTFTVVEDGSNTFDVALKQNVWGRNYSSSFTMTADLTAENYADTIAVSYYKASSGGETWALDPTIADGQMISFRTTFNGASEGKLAHGIFQSNNTYYNETGYQDNDMYIKHKLDGVEYGLTSNGKIEDSQDSATATGKYSPLAQTASYVLTGDYYAYDTAYVKVGTTVYMFVKMADQTEWINIAAKAATNEKSTLALYVASRTFAQNYTYSNLVYDTTGGTAFYNANKDNVADVSGAVKKVSDGKYEIHTFQKPPHPIYTDYTFDKSAGALEVSSTITVMASGQYAGIGFAIADPATAKMVNLTTNGSTGNWMASTIAGDGYNRRVYLSASNTTYWNAGGVTSINVSQVTNVTFKAKLVISGDLWQLYVSKSASEKDTLVHVLTVDMNTLFSSGTGAGSGTLAGTYPTADVVNIGAFAFADHSNGNGNFVSCVTKYTDYTVVYRTVEKLKTDKVAEIDKLVADNYAQADYSEDNWTTFSEAVTEAKEEVNALTTAYDLVNWTTDALKVELDAVPTLTAALTTITVTGAAENAYTLTCGDESHSGVISTEGTIEQNLSAGTWELSIDNNAEAFGKIMTFAVEESDYAAGKQVSVTLEENIWGFNVATASQWTMNADRTAENVAQTLSYSHYSTSSTSNFTLAPTLATGQMISFRTTFNAASDGKAAHAYNTGTGSYFDANVQDSDMYTKHVIGGKNMGLASTGANWNGTKVNNSPLSNMMEKFTIDQDYTTAYDLAYVRQDNTVYLLVKYATESKYVVISKVTVDTANATVLLNTAQRGGWISNFTYSNFVYETNATTVSEFYNTHKDNTVTISKALTYDSVAETYSGSLYGNGYMYTNVSGNRTTGTLTIEAEFKTLGGKNAGIGFAFVDVATGKFVNITTEVSTGNVLVSTADGNGWSRRIPVKNNKDTAKGVTVENSVTAINVSQIASYVTFKAKAELTGDIVKLYFPKSGSDSTLTLVYTIDLATLVKTGTYADTSKNTDEARLNIYNTYYPTAATLNAGVYSFSDGMRYTEYHSVKASYSTNS